MYQVNQWVKRATGFLEASQVPSARLDALILLEDATDKERGWLLAHPELVLTEEQIRILDQQIKHRANHEPLAYIRGKSDFYGRTFLVTPATLQPRPETETMITLLKSLGLPKATVVDVGTGSGAIAITTKLEMPNLVVHGTEIQPDALAVAQKNANVLGAEVNLTQGNLLEPLMNTKIDIVLANLPYVPSSHTINQAAMQEPAVAIFGGESGLELYEQMFDQIKKLKPKYVLTESLPFQHQDLSKIAAEASYQLKTSEDFIQVFECV